MSGVPAVQVAGGCPAFVSTLNTVEAQVPAMDDNWSKSTFATFCDFTPPFFVRTVKVAPPFACWANFGAIPDPVTGLVTK